MADLAEGDKPETTERGLVSSTHDSPLLGNEPLGGQRRRHRFTFATALPSGPRLDTNVVLHVLRDISARSESGTTSISKRNTHWVC